MQVFYSQVINDKLCLLDEKESGHCARVLRLRKGSRVNIVDGAGTLAEGILVDPDPRQCRISVTGIKKDYEKREYSLHIGISPLKNTDRFEWFIEKSVEIGIDVITPVICTNTEKTGVKPERLNGIIISAMKQSLKAFRPLLNEPVSFTEFQMLNLRGTRMIGHCSHDEDRRAISGVYKKGEDAVILIGPEGDFTPEEIREALGNGYIPVHLGRSRLRTETAGIAACHSVYFINQ